MPPSVVPEEELSLPYPYFFSFFTYTIESLMPPYFAHQVAFFSLTLFGDAAPVQALLAALSTSPLMLAVLAGAAQNVMTKSCKWVQTALYEYSFICFCYRVP